MKKRRRFKQTLSLQERLAAFASEVREQAAHAQPGPERDNLLRRASQAETAAQLEQWIKSPGPQPPK
jgi:hypothetical protein